MPGSYPSTSEYTTQNEYIGLHGVSEGQKQPNDISKVEISDAVKEEIKPKTETTEQTIVRDESELRPLAVLEAEYEADNTDNWTIAEWDYFDMVYPTKYSWEHRNDNKQSSSASTTTVSSGSTTSGSTDTSTTPDTSTSTDTGTTETTTTPSTETTTTPSETITPSETTTPSSDTPAPASETSVSNESATTSEENTTG